MFTKALPLLFLITVVSGGCTVTGPADDGWERGNETVDTGRLLSDETRTIYRSGKANASEPETLTAAGFENQDDYLAYKEWQQARDKNSPEYQKFKKWQEFEEFQRWKAQQGSAEK